MPVYPTVYKFAILLIFSQTGAFVEKLAFLSNCDKILTKAWLKNTMVSVFSETAAKEERMEYENQQIIKEFLKQKNVNITIADLPD